MPRLAPLAALALPLSLSGCSLLGITEKVDVDRTRVTFESGVEYEVLLPGIGEAAGTGDRVLVDYVGYLSSGVSFDSSRDRGVPVEVVVGEAPIRGWNEVLLGMRVGGVRRASIPPAEAYGAEGIEGLIPPDETVVFELELLELLEAAAEGTELEAD
jgi:FKBP-type peptidyl-prolyl cis-trans isomerase